MRYIIIHDTDHDGYASAWLLQHSLAQVNSNTPILCYPIVAGSDELPAVESGDHVYIVDKSYSHSQLIKLSLEVAVVTVVDHHKSFLDATWKEYQHSGLLASIIYENSELVSLTLCVDKLEVLIDTRSAACTLTAKFCDINLKQHIPGMDADYWFINYIADRDIWKWALPDSKEINAGIHTFPLSFDTFDQLYTGEIDKNQCHERGVGILAYTETLFSTMTSVVHSEESSAYNRIMYYPCQNVRVHNTTPTGEKPILVPISLVVAPCPFTPLISDFGSYLLEHTKADVAIMWRPEYDGTLTRWYLYSIRSKNVDVSGIAVKHGGGGHPNACGFKSMLPPAQIHHLF